MNQQERQKNSSIEQYLNHSTFFKIYDILSSMVLSNITLSEEESLCVTFSIVTNASMITNYFDTPEKKLWLDNNIDKLRELIQDTLFDKSHFITENYKTLKIRLEECMSSHLL